MEIDEKSTADVMTKFDNVVCLNLGQTLDENLLNEIKTSGYSRIPISLSSEQKTVIGIFLTKSLLGYKLCDETIAQAIKRNNIIVKSPVYFMPQTKLNAVCSAFKDGSSHMGVVVGSREEARYMVSQSDKILDQVHSGKYTFDKLDDHTISGILTLENVIEFILQMDIKDEKDREKENLKKQSSDAPLLQHRKSEITYEKQNLLSPVQNVNTTGDGKVRTESQFGVFKSKAMKRIEKIIDDGTFIRGDEVKGIPGLNTNVNPVGQRMRAASAMCDNQDALMATDNEEGEKSRNTMLTMSKDQTYQHVIPGRINYSKAQASTQAK